MARETIDSLVDVDELVAEKKALQARIVELEAKQREAAGAGSAAADQRAQGARLALVSRQKPRRADRGFAWQYTWEKLCSTPGTELFMGRELLWLQSCSLSRRWVFNELLQLFHPLGGILSSVEYPPGD
jgi:hypothetical protein